MAIRIARETVLLQPDSVTNITFEATARKRKFRIWFFTFGIHLVNHPQFCTKRSTDSSFRSVHK